LFTQTRTEHNAWDFTAENIFKTETGNSTKKAGKMIQSRSLFNTQWFRHAEKKVGKSLEATIQMLSAE